MSGVTRTAAPRRDGDVLPSRDLGRALPPRRRDEAAERDADRRAAGLGRSTVPHRRAQPSSAGAPLPLTVRRWAEPRVGLDLSAVRVHDDAEAHAATEERHARAVAAGTDVLFSEGEYRPETPSGRELLLHELAHIAQQAEDGVAATQHQPQPPRTTGIGRNPPRGDYVVAEAAAPDDEALNVLFAHDSAMLDRAFLERFREVLATHTGPVTVRIHGYASSEGEPGYNVNLSAHRAVGVADAIASLLPRGSSVRPIAHGQTDVFGEPGRNRRVGIGISDLPAESGFTLDAETFLRRHPFVLGDFRLRLDPLSPVGEAVPSGRTPAGVASGATERRRLPGGVLDWTFGDPADLIGVRTPRTFLPDPVGAVAPRVPWGLLSEDFAGRGLVLGDGDQAMILRHWQLYHPLARAAYGIAPVRWFFDSPDDVMTSLTRKMISNSFAGERPNAVEAFDQELQRLGIPTPIYTPSFELRFDADFRNWRRP